MKQPGHMDNKYFIERSDPIHRKPELFQPGWIHQVHQAILSG